MNDAEALLWVVGLVPHLLDPAPADVDLTHLQHRERNEVHQCFWCGERAGFAVVASTRIGCRWLDLCCDCYIGIRRYYGKP